MLPSDELFFGHLGFRLKSYYDRACKGSEEKLLNAFPRLTCAGGGTRKSGKIIINYAMIN